MEGRVEKSLLPLDNEGKPIVLTAEREAKGDIESVYSDDTRGGAEHRSFSFPLDYLLQRTGEDKKSLISPKQYRAGNRLHQLWYYGFCAQHTLMRYGSVGGGGADYEAVRLRAIRYVKACEAIRDEHKQIVYEVCCLGKMLSGLSGFTSAPTARRKGLPLLKAGLDDLAEHFGYNKKPCA